MGFLGFFKKTRPEEPEQKEQLKPEGLVGWFEQTLEADASSAREEAKAIHSGISMAFKDIGATARALEKVKFNGDERVHVAANMVKDTIVKRVMSARLDVPGFKPEHSFLEEFQREAAGTIDGLMSMTPKQAFLLSRYFGKESERFIASVRDARKGLDSLDSFLKSEGKVLLVQEGIETGSKKYRQFGEELVKVRKGAEQAKNNVRKGEDRLKEAESGLETFMSGPGWKGFSKLKEETKEKRSELEQLKLRITSELSSVRRPLKKLRHAGEHASDAFLVEPFMFLMENGEGAVKTLVEKSIETIAAKNITLKPAEMKKLRALARDMESGIPGMKSRYVRLRDELKGPETGNSQNLPDEKDALERKVEQARKGLEELNSVLVRAEKHSTEVSGNISKLKKELEQLINQNTDKQVVIENGFNQGAK